MEHYWYVTDVFENKGKSGNGYLIIRTNKEWFPIQTTRKFIEKEYNFDLVVISNWKTVSNYQVEEMSEPS